MRKSLGPPAPLCGWMPLLVLTAVSEDGPWEETRLSVCDVVRARDPHCCLPARTVHLVLCAFPCDSQRPGALSRAPRHRDAL